MRPRTSAAPLRLAVGVAHAEGRGQHGLHLSVLASAAGLVPMIIKAKTGAQVVAVLSARPLLFGAEATKATAQLAKWRGLTPPPPPPKP